MKRFVLITLVLSTIPAAGAVAQTRYVSSCGHDSQVGYTDNCSAVNPWERPVRSIQRAIEVLPNGGEIIVLPGTYTGAFDLGDRNYTIRAQGGPDVTFIDASGLTTPVMRIEGGQSAATVIDGFTISGYAFPTFGGAVRITGTSTRPLFANCTFKNNAAEIGGAVHISAASPEFRACRFVQNAASQTGGGIFNSDGGTMKIDGCTFVGNASGVGAAIRNNASAVISNCLFLGNLITGSGSAISNDQPGATISIINCSFYEIATATTGSFVESALSTVSIRNSILWGAVTPVTQHPSQGSTTVSYCDVQGGHAGVGNINVVPGFVNPFVGNYHLMPTSPCVDAGDAMACALAGVTHDFDGTVRAMDFPSTPDSGITFWGQAVDIGALELPGSPTSAPCPADLTHDGVVSGLDLASLLAAWGSCK